MRLFIALNIPEEIRKKLYEEAVLLKKEGMFEGKVTGKDNLHLTLKFLGDVEEEKVGEIKERLNGISLGKFDVMLGGLGVFDENFVRIIWASLLGVEELQGEVDRVLLGMFPREERFMGHVTIARVKNVKEKRSLIDRLKVVRLDNFKFRVESFELMKSELSKSGPEYEVLEKIELG